MRFFRHCIPERRQDGWEQFWLIRWRGFDAPDPARREHFARATRRLRRRMAVWLAALTIVAVAAAVAVWRWTGDAQPLRALVYLPLLWPVVWLANADRGRIAEKSAPDAAVNGLVVTGLVVFALTWAGVLGCAVFFPAATRTLLFVGIVASVILMMAGLLSQSAGIERRRKEGARLAEKEYIGTARATAAE